MQCWIEISRSALIQNYTIFSDILGQKGVIPILKSNAYGHGLTQTFEVLRNVGLNWIGVNYLSEAETLRKLGYDGNILNVGPFSEEALKKAYELKTQVLIGNREIFEAWRKLPERAQIHLKLDTGLSRRGFSFEDLQTLLPEFKKLKAHIVGLATHFANVEDVTNSDFAYLQLSRLLKAAAFLRAEGFPSLLVHAASSASTLLIKQSRLDLCRIGISLFGLWASELTRLSYQGTFQHAELELKPVLSWRTRLNSLRDISEGDYVGYGCTFKAPRAMKIGLIPVGYYEGYPRIAGGRRAHALVRGRRCSILGRICMNMSMIDLDNVPEACIGDIVTLIGRDRNEEVTAEQLGLWADTIHYEIVTRLNSEIPRIIV